MTIDGRVDAYWADHLDAALADAIAEGHHRIALDCSKVNFLSSAGIGAIVKHYKALAAINGSLIVVAPSRPVITLLRMTKLDELLSGIRPEPAAPRAAPASPPAAVTSRRIDADGLA